MEYQAGGWEEAGRISPLADSSKATKVLIINEIPIICLGFLVLWRKRSIAYRLKAASNL